MKLANGEFEGLIHERTAAKLLGLSRSNLRRRRASCLPPDYVRIGGRVLYRPSVLDAFIEESAVKSSEIGCNPAVRE